MEVGLTLTDLVMTIVDALAGTTPGKIPAKNLAVVRTALENYDASLNEWKRYEFWDSCKKYTRNLIATDNENFTLMLLCWLPEKESPIHNHAGSECFVRVVQGAICETKFEQPANDKDPLKMTEKLEHSAGSVTFMNDSLGLHKVGNATSDKPAMTLHCYLPPYQSCLCYLDQTGKGVPILTTFYSENGNRVDFGEPTCVRKAEESAKKAATDQTSGAAADSCSDKSKLS